VSEAVDPTAGTWHDQAPAVAAAVATQLRLEETHPDRARLEAQARGAMRAIDGRLDLRSASTRLEYLHGGVVVTTYADGDVPADVLEAAHQLTAELYRRKDVRFGIITSGGPMNEPVRVSRDQLAGVESLLAPYVEGWGLS
jgi:hypothetical protein